MRISSPAEYAAVIEDIHARRVTDGIPVVPPTAQRMEAMLASASRRSHAVVGAFPGRHPIRVRDLAEVAVMAGCLPQYMPLVLTALETILSPGFPSRLFYESSASYFPLVLVNGPVRAQLAINCRPNVLGPGFRANATIGRALRLALLNFAGARPGDGDNSTLGTAYKFTCVVGEDEEESPWPALHTEFGFSPQDSTVTVLAAWQPRQVTHQLSREPEELLRAFAEELSTLTQFSPVYIALEGGSHAPKAVLMLAEDHRKFMREAGWTRARMQAFLHQVTGRRAGDVRAAGFLADARLKGKSDDWVPIYASPDDFLIVSTGSGGGRSMIGGAAYAATRALPYDGIIVSRASSAPPPAEPETIDDYADIADRFIEQGASDGWPVLLPDTESVVRFVDASGCAADEIVGHSPWRSGPVTVSDVAVNAVMAGCKAEHMPLVIAICRLLFTKDDLNCGASTIGLCPWFIVHGPAVSAFELNCKAGLFGPGTRANATIGRATRLALVNLGGYTPNVVDRSCLGTAYKYGCVIGEDEAASPWPPLHADFGFATGESAVTLLWAYHPRLTMHQEASDPETLLRAVAEDLSTVQYWDSPAGRSPAETTSPEGSAWTYHNIVLQNRSAFIVFGGEHREILRRHGWTRDQVRTFLFARASRKVGDLRKTGYGATPFFDAHLRDDERVPMYLGREKIIPMIAGGDGGGATMSAQIWYRHSASFRHG